MIALSSSSCFVASSANIFLVFFVVGYNKFTVVSFRFFLSILSDLDPLTLTIILSIFVVDIVVSRYMAGTLPSFLFLVSGRLSIPFLPQSDMEGSCVALSWEQQILCVPHFYLHWASLLYWGDISILCGIHHIHTSSSSKGYCVF